MDEIQMQLNEFITAVKGTSVYQEYVKQRDSIKAYPELKNEMDELRMRNFQLQNSENQENFMEEIELLEQEYLEFRENPLVNDFLMAELAFCRMIQEIDDEILSAVEADFE